MTKFTQLVSNKLLGYIKKKILNYSSISHPQSVDRTSQIINSILDGPIKVGAGCIIRDSILQSSDMEIGKQTTLWGPNITVNEYGSYIRIGSFCSIGKNVTIQGYNHNPRKITTYFTQSNLFHGNFSDDIVCKGPIVIGSDVWIASNVTIGSGVTVGHGAVIGANSLILADVPPYAFVAGSPARVIDYRFSREIIDHLLVIKWWEWDMTKINKNKNLFNSEITAQTLASVF
jgi:virginiamycin A acetyltransferase